MVKYEKKYHLLQLEGDGVKEGFFRDTHYNRVTTPDFYCDFDTEEEALEQAAEWELDDFILVPSYSRVWC